MRKHDRHGKVLVLLVCLAVVAAFCMGCSSKRSVGEAPVIVEDEENTGFQKPTNEVQGNTGETYEHVGVQKQFPGGIEPDDYKAQKLVNQLFNYCVGLCSMEQECPADLKAAKDGIRKQYKIFWPKDPWGNSYQYKKVDEMNCEVWSFGPDGKDGTDDDIHISKSNREDLPD